MRATMSNRIVFFDLGNVLVTFDHEIASRQLSELYGVPIDDTRRAVFDSGLQREYESGRITTSDYVATLNVNFGCSIADELVLRATSSIFAPNESMLEVVDQLRGSDTRLGVLSNTCECHWRWLQAQPWSVPQDRFDSVVLSYEVGAMKPDRRIYLAAEKLAKCSGQDIFFVDDLEANITAAKTLGWNAVVFEGAEDLVDQLDLWQGDR